MHQEKREPWWDRLNRALFPYLGPAQLGPFGEEPLPPTGPKPCPLCGQPMDRHRVERSGGNVATRLHCPEADVEAVEASGE